MHLGQAYFCLFLTNPFNDRIPFILPIKKEIFT